MMLTIPCMRSAPRLGSLRLLLSGLFHHRRAHLGAALGSAVASAVLTGALLVGDSVEETLRRLALSRLGRLWAVVLAERPFRAALADSLGRRPAVRETFGRPAPALFLEGSAAAPGPDGGGPRRGGVSVLGVDGAGLESLGGVAGGSSSPPAGRRALVNRRLADELGLQPGSELVLSLEEGGGAARESLAGRRDDPTRSVRLEVGSVIPDQGAGTFSLRADQRVPRNVLVDRDELSRAIGLAGRANALLYAGPGDRQGRRSAGGLQEIEEELRSEAKPEDLGLRFKVIEWQPGLPGIQVESEGFLLPEPVEQALLATAAAERAPARVLFTYLANTIALARPGSPRREIPYSTVTAIGAATFPGAGSPEPLAPGEILLGAWARDDLGAVEGDRVELEYYVVETGGELRTERTTFRVREGSVDLAADASLTPDFPGVTSARNLSDWDPPFPVDLKRIRSKDEEYWKAHRAAPKAFISLEDGRRLWGSRFGRSTAVRLAPPAYEGTGPAAAAPGSKPLENRKEELQEKLQVTLLGGLKSRLPLGEAGFTFRAVREEALSRSEAATDFSGLFLGFSSFLIGSAALLTGLLWALGLERRAREWGILRAMGFRVRWVRRLLMAEAALVAGAGTVVGLLLAPLYARFLVAGLHGMWSSAMRPPRLDLHVSTRSFAVGFAASLGVVLFSTALASIRIARASPLSLLQGGFARGGARARPAGSLPGRRSRYLGVGPLVALALLLLAAGLVAAGSLFPPLAARAGAELFFGAGAALLTAGLFFLGSLVFADRRAGGAAGAGVRFRGTLGLLWLGVLNGRRHPGRSILTASLMASASFVVVAVGGSRPPAGGDEGERSSGTGGYRLVATSEVPLFHRFDEPRGRAALGLPETLAGSPLPWSEIESAAFRVKDGDDASCLNLYRPGRPRILGAGAELVRRGGFRFGSALPAGGAAAGNRWLLLERELPGGAVPAIADEATARWALHLGLGEELRVQDGRGGAARLRLVALLEGSVLQGSLIVSEGDLLRLFPGTGGYRYFLIGGPPAAIERLGPVLRDGLAPYGFDPVPAGRVLAELETVEEAYLETFSLLGGMGLLLGAAGLGAVLLRGAMERRGELALLRALGYRRSALTLMVFAENALLVAAGLGTGTVAALLAAAPQLASGGSGVGWGSLALTLLGSAAVGLAGGLLAVGSALRAPLLPALRAE
jgi:putative ABC transport system permease protein